MLFRCWVGRANERHCWRVSRRLGRIALLRQDWATSHLPSSERPLCTVTPASGWPSCSRARAIAESQLADPAGAARLLYAVLAEDPTNEAVFDSLRRLFTDNEAWRQLAELLANRATVETDANRVLALHLELAGLCRDRLNDHEAAKHHLRQALAVVPAHQEALRALGDLHAADDEWQQAAAVLIQRVQLNRATGPARRVPRTRANLLGAAQGRYASRRVLCARPQVQADPSGRPAETLRAPCQNRRLEIGSDHHFATGRAGASLNVKVEALLRLARIHDEGFGDALTAQDVLRRASEADPKNLAALEAMVQFHQRQNDSASAQRHIAHGHYDRASQRNRRRCDEPAGLPCTVRHSLVARGSRTGSDDSRAAAGHGTGCARRA